MVSWPVFMMLTWDIPSVVQVISLGDKIKFSLSPSKSKDRLTTNVPGVPLDDRNLVNRAFFFLYILCLG